MFGVVGLIAKITFPHRNPSRVTNKPVRGKWSRLRCLDVLLLFGFVVVANWRFPAGRSGIAVWMIRDGYFFRFFDQAPHVSGISCVDKVDKEGDRILPHPALRRYAMRIAQSKPLFAWNCLDDSPSLKVSRAA